MSSRRTFLKTSFLTLALCIFSKGRVHAAISPMETISLLQEDLFPLIKTFQSNSALYFVTILNHSLISNNDKQFIRNGVKWLNEESVNYYYKTFTKLNYDERYVLLQTISKEQWGEKFIFMMLSFIMESVLGDPVYNINHNQQGWKWLGHETGYPQPKEAFL